MNKPSINDIFELNKLVFGMLRLYPNNPNKYVSSLCSISSTSLLIGEHDNQRATSTKLVQLGLVDKLLNKYWVHLEDVTVAKLTQNLEFFEGTLQNSFDRDKPISLFISNILKLINEIFDVYTGHCSNLNLRQSLLSITNTIDLSNLDQIENYYHYSIFQIINQLQSFTPNIETIAELNDVQVLYIEIFQQLNTIHIENIKRLNIDSINLGKQKIKKWIDIDSLHNQIRYLPSKNIKGKSYYNFNNLKDTVKEFLVCSLENESTQKDFANLFKSYQIIARLPFIHNIQYEYITSDEYRNAYEKDSFFSDEIFSIYLLLNNYKYNKALSSRKNEFYPFKDDINCYHYIFSRSPNFISIIDKLGEKLNWPPLRKAKQEKCINLLSSSKNFLEKVTE